MSKNYISKVNGMVCKAGHLLRRLVGRVPFGRKVYGLILILILIDRRGADNTGPGVGSEKVRGVVHMLSWIHSIGHVRIRGGFLIPLGDSLCFRGLRGGPSLAAPFLPLRHRSFYFVIVLQARWLFVFIQVRLEGERLAAPQAAMGLCVRMRLNVSAEVGLVGKSFGADGTLEGLFSWRNNRNYY